MLKIFVIFCLSCCCLHISVEAAPFGSDVMIKKDFFYHQYKGEQRGSRSLFSPLSYYFNSTFDVEQNPYYFNQKTIWKDQLTIFKNIEHPIKSIIVDGGFFKFFRNEIIGLRSIPNYTLHMIGGGHDFRLMYEYFISHQYSYPFTLALLVQYAGHIGNESFESSNRSLIHSHDHLADLIIFDSIGIYLFLNEEVVKIFNNKMHLELWTFQPMFDGHKFSNAGLNYIVRPLSYNRYSLFAFMGMQTLFGISYKLFENKKYYLTFASGPVFVDPLNDIFKISYSFFLDVDGNLLASAMFNTTSNLKIRLNLYPNLFRGYNFSLFYGLNEQNQSMFGINYKLPFGVIFK